MNAATLGDSGPDAICPEHRNSGTTWRTAQRGMRYSKSCSHEGPPVCSLKIVTERQSRQPFLAC